MTIEIANESGISIDESTVISLARYTLAQMGVHPLAALSMLVVAVGPMSDLNQQWMDKQGPTDVLAFPMDAIDMNRGPGNAVTDEDTVVGDIVLCPEVAAQQAAEAGHTTMDELCLLTVHGILHLLGYDHAEAAEKKEMFELQDRLLLRWRAEGNR